jgi:hypothetical protein
MILYILYYGVDEVGFEKIAGAVTSKEHKRYSRSPT